MKRLSKLLHLLAVVLLMFSIGCVPPEQSEPVKKQKDLFEQAKVFELDGEYDKAVVTYQMVAVNDSTSERAPSAFYEVGKIQFFMLNKPEDSIQTLEKLVKEYPNHGKAPYAQFLVGNIMEEPLAKYLGAINAYSNLLRIYPDSKLAANSQYRIAQCYYKLNDYSQAMSEFGEILDKYAKSKFVDSAMYRIGDIYYVTENYKKAVKMYLKLVSEFPNSVHVRDARFYMAQCRENLLEFDTAIKDYKELIKISSGVDIDIAKKAIKRVMKKKKQDKLRQKSRLNPRRR